MNCTNLAILKSENIRKIILEIQKKKKKINKQNSLK